MRVVSLPLLRLEHPGSRARLWRLGVFSADWEVVESRLPDQEILKVVGRDRCVWVVGVDIAVRFLYFAITCEN